MTAVLRLVLTLSLSLLLLGGNADADELWLISANTQQVEISKEVVKQIYLQGEQGRTPLQPVNLVKGEFSRTIFNALVMGLTESRLQSYWSQMRFTGRSRPPLEVENTKVLTDYLLNNSNAIGYLVVDDNTQLPDGLVVLLKIDFEK
ncbi:hypothetical protein [Alishewanella sp. SMS8]|uniref:hypothetical protein n=1 Tax=Alishewanella sp. SMS8 TaxID=2994676 RepID=UPI0027410F88|nr:hypothetical protein [Alishewanella sp. SMS8]MDP5035254.1 hypothetical protein [Alishewanella sp.]MDP5187175.1 hypothetical protein [Alishewanella sp.]MDP5206417.1 hypothetical protein [Alishewanella sp. SMS9]MDP5459147.1 hypothetical protein [Alishewanella sp. SMS8]